MINIRRDFARFAGSTLLILAALLTVEGKGTTFVHAAPTDDGDPTVSAAVQTINAALHATPTPSPTPTPNLGATATAQAAQVATAVVATLTAQPATVPTRTRKPAPTPTPAPTDTPPAPLPTAPPVVRNTPTRPAPTNTPAAPARPDLVSDFETFGVWQRGSETWGALTQSNENKTAGAAAAKLVYDFSPAQPENDFVVFVRKPPLPIPGQPKGLNLQVYGDGSGNFLNAWVQDSVGQIWQFTFGRINHTGWQLMSAPLDPTLGWPNAVVQNNQSASLSYPLHFYALVLDGEPRQVMQGALFFDDLLTTDNPARPALSGNAAGAAPASAEPAAPSPDTLPDESCGVDPPAITAGQTALLYWKFTGVKAVYLDGQGVLGIDSKLVKPGKTTVYTVRVIRSDGSETSCLITVQVH